MSLFVVQEVTIRRFLLFVVCFVCLCYLYINHFSTKLPPKNQSNRSYSLEDEPKNSLRASKQEETENTRQLTNAMILSYPDTGTSTYLTNRTVHGALIPYCEHHNLDTINPYHCHNTSFYAESLPFPLVLWPIVSTTYCPYYSIEGSPDHHHEHGLGLSHLQVWLEFVFYDLDVLDGLTREPPEYLENIYHTSISGHFQAFDNGTLQKNHVPYQDNDILVIIEDIAYWNATKENLDLLYSMLNHLQGEDIVLLGNPHIDISLHQKKTPVTSLHTPTNSTTSSTIIGSNNIDFNHFLMYPLDENRTLEIDYSIITRDEDNSNFYAYAITRSGARKLIEYYDVCGDSLTIQLENLIEYGLLTTPKNTSMIFTHYLDPLDHSKIPFPFVLQYNDHQQEHVPLRGHHHHQHSSHHNHNKHSQMNIH